MKVPHTVVRRTGLEESRKYWLGGPKIDSSNREGKDDRACT